MAWDVPQSAICIKVAGGCMPSEGALEEITVVEGMNGNQVGEFPTTGDEGGAVEV
jgi:hypothetical protein